MKGRVQLGTYRLRSRGLQVSQLFLNDVDALPLEYEKGQYFGFMEDYGTHFTKNGKAGGEYELIYVLNKNTKKDKRKCKSFHVVTADEQSLKMFMDSSDEQFQYLIFSYFCQRPILQANTEIPIKRFKDAALQ